ncbi:putative membrane protein [Shigella dysenteriae 1012]|nr:putative membrane protein [Shigella dysenteriae 1012]
MVRRLRFSGPKTSIICTPMTSLKTSIKTITYLSDTGCLEIQGASLTVMDNKISTYSPAFSIVSWIALVGGIVTYLLGLWNAEMQLNEKGYYFAVLVLGLFSAASYQKTVRDKYEGIPTTSIYYMTCLTVFIISVALLMVGLWNATLLLSEKGFYGLAFFLSLFGAVAVQKNIRDAGINPPKETQVTQEEYSE